MRNPSICFASNVVRNITDFSVFQMVVKELLREDALLDVCDASIEKPDDIRALFKGYVVEKEIALAEVWVKADGNHEAAPTHHVILVGCFRHGSAEPSSGKNILLFQVLAKE